MKRLQFKKMQKTAAIAACCLLFTAWGGSITSFAHTPEESIYLGGSWVQDEVGWRFYSEWNSIYPAGQWGEYQEHSYYFMDNSYMATGWTFINGRWYCFNPYGGKYHGSMMTGWIYDSNYDGWFYTNEFGIMVTGWHKIDGFWYYFNENPDGTMGLMAADQFIDGSYVKANGQMNDSK